MAGRGMDGRKIDDRKIWRNGAMKGLWASGRGFGSGTCVHYMDLPGFFKRKVEQAD